MKPIRTIFFFFLKTFSPFARIPLEFQKFIDRHLFDFILKVALLALNFNMHKVYNQIFFCTKQNRYKNCGHSLCIISKVHAPPIEIILF